MSNRFLAAVVCASLAGTALGLEPGDGVIREGEGARRTSLNQRELKPFDASAWSALTDWKNGSALSAGATSGRPVLIMTWTDYIPASKRAFALAQKMAEAHAADGLIVVCAHGKEEWAAAVKPAPKAGTLLLAHDATGAFRTAIASDNDPDFYLIDRAGQLRYADIATESVEAATDLLCKETKELAAGVNGKIDEAAQARDAEIKRAEILRQGVDLSALPEIPFEKPADSAYKSARWPDVPKDSQGYQQPGEKPEAQKAPLPEVGWYPKKPELAGRVVVMYFWHPDIPKSYKDIARFDLIQTQKGRDVVVVGVISPLSDVNSSSPNDPKIEMDPEKLQVKLNDFKRSRPLGHSLLLDLQGSLFTVSKTYYQNYSQGVPVPWVGVCSSDGMMRWWGWMGSPQYQAALDRVMLEDPGVRARQKAEQDYIRSKQSK